MRLLYNIKLHQKALIILEMIEKCNIYTNTAKGYLTKWDNSNWFDMVRIVNKREHLVEQVEKYAAIKKRLTQSYINVMDRINSNAMDYLASKLETSENY